MSRGRQVEAVHERVELGDIPSQRGASATVPPPGQAWPPASQCDPEIPAAGVCSSLGPVLTTAQLAHLLGMPTEAAARKFMDRHEIPHVRLGKHRLIVTASFLEFLVERETTAGSLRATQEADAQAEGRTLASAARSLVAASDKGARLAEVASRLARAR